MKDLEDKLKQLCEEYNKVEVPEEGLSKMKEAIDRAKLSKSKSNRLKLVRRSSIAAAAVALLVVLPNTHESISYAMGSVPVIGRFFEVVTIRNYKSDNGNSSVNVDMPKVESGTESEQSVSKLNEDVQKYVDRILNEFKSEVDEGNGSYQSLDVSYEVISDTDNWFTLAIYAVDTKASGYEFRKYYHIDKSMNSLVRLEDLFIPDSDFKSVVNKSILEQMSSANEKEEATFWIKNEENPDGFESIAEDQDFYLDVKGNLIIVFDEYEVAPGYMGCPEFVIERKSVQSYLK